MYARRVAEGLVARLTCTVALVLVACLVSYLAICCSRRINGREGQPVGVCEEEE